MVKTIRALLVAAAVLGGVSGCNMGIGIFPDRLTSYEGYADLAGLIEPDRIQDFNFQIIRDSRTTAGNVEYLVLANDNRDFDGVHVAIFNTNLKVLGTFTFDDLDAMDPDNEFNGRAAMVDANGDIVVGNRRFTVGARQVTYAATPPMTLYTLGLALPEAAQPNYVNIWTESVSSVFFKYETHTADWSAPSAWDPLFKGGMFAAKIHNLWLRDTDVAAIIWVEGQGTNLHLLDRSSFASNTLCVPIETCYPPTGVYGESDVWWETLGYTDDGFAAFFSGPLSKYGLFDTSGALIASSSSPSDDEWPHDQRHVYGRTEGWYILKMRDMTLERRPWWWLP